MGQSRRPPPRPVLGGHAPGAAGPGGKCAEPGLRWGRQTPSPAPASAHTRPWPLSEAGRRDVSHSGCGSSSQRAAAGRSTGWAPPHGSVFVKQSPTVRRGASRQAGLGNQKGLQMASEASTPLPTPTHGGRHLLTLLSRKGRREPTRPWPSPGGTPAPTDAPGVPPSGVRPTFPRSPAWPGRCPAPLSRHSLVAL